MSVYQDTIKSLPVDEEPVENMYLADSIFKQDPSMVSKLASEFKEFSLIAVLFVLFSSEQFDNLIRKNIPIADKSPIILIGIKCSVVIFLFYVIKNLQLVRKQ